MTANTVPANRTRNDIRHMFDLWKIEQFSIIREQEEFVGGRVLKGQGATVTYLRKGQWQTVSCTAASQYDENLRSIFSFLDRIRIAEKTGVAYQGLSSVKDLVKTTSDPKAEEQETLAEAFDILGVKSDDPTDLIERVYRAKAQSFHPDSVGGDEAKMKRLNAAHELVMKSRGQK
ncbi:MAG: J domain-containing protein [Dehalococcoidales bacterium]|nr:J domain-containing protein [Dehalococcoidales bacterium]